MFFKQSNSKYQETDRITKYKMIKSGKHWLRAATSNFNLLRILKGGSSVVKVENRSESTTTAIVKGAAAAGVLVGGAVVANTAYAEEIGDNTAIQSELSSETATVVTADSVVIGTTSTTESDTTSVSTSTSLSDSVSVSVSTSASLSDSASVSLSESNSISNSVSVSSSNITSNTDSTSESSTSEVSTESNAVVSEVSTSTTAEEVSTDAPTVSATTPTVETPEAAVAAATTSLNPATTANTDLIAVATTTSDNTKASDEEKETTTTDVSSTTSTRTAFLVYKAVYVDAESGKRVASNQASSVPVETTNPVSQPVVQDVTITAGTVNGYKLADGQAATIVKSLTEGKSEIVTFKVTATGETAAETTSFRADTSSGSSSTTVTDSSPTNGATKIETTQNGTISPEMSTNGKANANGATVSDTWSLTDYKQDEDPTHYTFGVQDYGYKATSGAAANNLSEYLNRNGYYTNGKLYATFAKSKTSGDNTVYVTLRDANQNHKVLETLTISEANNNSVDSSFIKSVTGGANNMAYKYVIVP